MINAENNQLIADVTRDIIAQTEPGELSLFQAISAEYFKKPAKAVNNQSGTDEMLGFGIGETASLLTLAMFVVMTQVVSIILTSAYNAALGTILALPVVLVVYFAARWIRRSRMHKNDEILVPPAASTSSKL